jgi:hypothetical protein
MQKDRQTDRTKLIVALHNSVNAPNQASETVSFSPASVYPHMYKVAQKTHVNKFLCLLNPYLTLCKT